MKVAKRIYVFMLSGALLALAVSCGATSTRLASTTEVPVSPGETIRASNAEALILESGSPTGTASLATTASPTTAPDVPARTMTPVPTATRAATATLSPPLETDVSTFFYAAPNGSPQGNGSFINPWDLATALAHPDAVQPGDTIWLRGGTYTGIFTTFLQGEEDAPITVRSYPGEWAVIDTQATSSQGNAFNIRSHWTNYWDFELTNRRLTDRGGGMKFQGGTYNRFINLIIHDMAHSNSFGEPNEFYGCIFYNNGLDGAQGHQLYIQNADASQPSRIVDSIIINGFAFGVHAYAGGVGLLNGIYLIGNVWFNNGVAQTEGNRKDNVLIGGVNGTSGLLLQENMGWAPTAQTRSVALGRYSHLNEDIVVVDNYLVGNTVFYNTWQSVTMTGNTFFSMSPGIGTNFDPMQFPGNDYLNSPPAATKIFIRPNQYEAGRAHIAVYNWEMSDTAEVDLTGILLHGDMYEVRNAQNYFAPPVAAGTYNGEPITLPLASLEPAQPIGSGWIEPSEQTGKNFNVFVLRRTGIREGSWRHYLPLVTSAP